MIVHLILIGVDMTAINAIRGLMHGAGSASLLDIQQQPCTATALKVNHLLLTSAQTLYALGNPINTMALMVTTACALTPAILADSQNLVSFSESTRKQINVVYQTGIVVNSVAMLALGNPAFALASLAVLALNATATGQIKEILEGVKRACGAITLAIYGAHLFSSRETLASAASFSAVLVGVRAILNAVQPYAKEVKKSEPAVQKEQPGLKNKTISKEEVIVTDKVVVPEPVVEERWLFKPMFS
jgi:hypothetical protein